MADAYTGPLKKLDDNRFLIPRSYKQGMLVDGLIFSSERLLRSIAEDKAPEQVANVACLPGIVKYSIAMPDIHWGYGFCIGGVAATDPERGGVISPGGVGYDINCGVRLVRTNLTKNEARPRLQDLVDALFSAIPTGMGQRSPVSFNRGELAQLMHEGSPYVIRKGFGWEEDSEATEARGTLAGAQPDLLSDRAYERGGTQCGSLGSGNHFLEVQTVDRIDDPHAAEVYGLFPGQVTVMIHSGSRGLGYQVCEDALFDLRDAPKKYGIKLPDRQLICAPFRSEEGKRYFGAMNAAANFAWANRQIMTHLTREVFEQVFGRSAEALGMSLVYDVAHNIAKLEEYEIDGMARQLCVHRKGATRAFPPGHPETPERYRSVGQPVLIPGDMGRYSYVLAGQPGSMQHSFGSSCHGAGRRLSRSAAIRASRGRSIADELLARGVVARARGRTGLAEEQPDAYKDVLEVVDVVHNAGISKRVARLAPLAVIKG